MPGFGGWGKTPVQFYQARLYVWVSEGMEIFFKKLLHAMTHRVVWEGEGRGCVTCQLLPRSWPVKLASSLQAIFLVWCQFTPNMDGSRLVYTCCYGSFRSGCRQSLEQPLPLLPNSFGTRLNAWFQDDASVSGWCGFYFGKHLSSGQSGRL